MVVRCGPHALHSSFTGSTNRRSSRSSLGDGVDPDHEFVIPARWRQPRDRESAKPNATTTIARNRKQRFIALVAGADDSADGFISKLYAANIEELQVRWIPAIDDEGPQ